MNNKVKKVKISDLIPDAHNANLGTERGRYMLEKSIQDLGFGRSLLLDKHGRIIAGNKSHEVAGATGLNDVIVVQTDGTQIVAVQRTDLDLNVDSKAQKLAIADNRVGEISLSWDTEVLLEISEEVNLGDYFKADELEAFLQAGSGDAGLDDDDNDGIEDDLGGKGQKEIKCVCPSCGHKFVKV